MKCMYSFYIDSTFKKACMSIEFGKYIMLSFTGLKKNRFEIKLPMY